MVDYTVCTSGNSLPKCVLVFLTVVHKNRHSCDDVGWCIIELKLAPYRNKPIFVGRSGKKNLGLVETPLPPCRGCFSSALQSLIKDSG